MQNFYNSEYSSRLVNAYVGGDAYNYIINGTYAIAFFVLTAWIFYHNLNLPILMGVERRGSTVRNDGAPIFCFYGESLNYFRAGGVDGEVAHLPVVRKRGDGGGELFGKVSVARQAEKARPRAADAESLAA